jgi:hypothetical protein
LITNGTNGANCTNKIKDKGKCSTTNYTKKSTKKSFFSKTGEGQGQELVHGGHEEELFSKTGEVLDTGCREEEIG